MNKQECFVIYTLKINENTTEVKQTTLILDLDESIEDQLYDRFPNLVDWKWEETNRKV